MGEAKSKLFRMVDLKAAEGREENLNFLIIYIFTAFIKKWKKIIAKKTSYESSPLLLFPKIFFRSRVARIFYFAMQHHLLRLHHNFVDLFSGFTWFI